MQPYQQRQLIEKYINSERGSFEKPFGSYKSSVLVFPNSYHVGMSNLGFQVVYKIINQRDDFLCDRFFTDFELTLENQRHLNEFDIIFFSVPFEMDYPNILKILSDSRIPLLSKDRDDRYPIIAIGGIGVLVNPLPIADFVDVIIPDEAEPILDKFFEIYNKNSDRNDFFEELAKTDNFIVPSLMNDSLIHEKIEKRCSLKELNNSETMTQIYTPLTEFSNMCLIEISRGCAYNCPFCFVGGNIKPYRIRHFEKIKEMIDKGMQYTKSFGFVSSAVCSHPDIERVCDYCNEHGLSASFSSLRLQDITPKIIETLVKSGQETFTIAPEAGTERLRKVLKKSTDDELILKVVKQALQAGILNIKLYFMIDLPTETQEDIDGIVKLSQKIYNEMTQSAKGSAKIGDLILNIGIFIPKPNTPFSNHIMSAKKDLNNKIKYLNSELKKIKNMKLTITSVKSALNQYEIAHGDRNFLKKIN